MYARPMTRTTVPALGGAMRRPLARAPRRTLVRAPRAGEGPMMERRPDRELPSVESVTFRWRRTLPLFGMAMALSAAAIFNYQKSSSPVVASTLYALRTSARARELLGDDIYFKHAIPWISGEMNQLRGRIDISFSVRGTRAQAVMRFSSVRPSVKAMYETTGWTLEMADGRVIDLLDDGDPFRAMRLVFDDDDEVERRSSTRGFRQQVK